MITGGDVLTHLIPSGGWVIYGNDYDSIIYDEGVSPTSKKAFDDAFDKVAVIKKAEAEMKTTAKAALLERLGITADEAAILLS